MKVALYARVSRPDEHLENQLKRLWQYAEFKGYSIVAECVDTASGADPNRPGWQQVMDLSTKGSIDAILTVRLDRAMRSTIELLDALRTLEARGVALVCCDQPIDTSSGMGRLMITILAAMAEFERELISERTKAGLARARAQGVRLGRPPKEKGGPVP